MKKLFTKARYLLALVSLVLMTIGAMAQQKSTITLYHPTSDKLNVLSGSKLCPDASDGWKMQCLNTSKNLEQSSSITVGDAKYASIKLSNGAQNQIWCPEGFVMTKVIVYSYVNANESEDTAGSYWKEVNGVEYTKETATAMKSYKDGTNPDVASFDLGGVSTFTITNTGKQPCCVFVIEYEEVSGDDDSRDYSATTTWNFMQWSEATVNNLKADAAASEKEGWSDVEKLEENTTAEASKDNCFWAITTPNDFGELSADGVVIEELKGLVFGTNVSDRGLAIAVNYPEASGMGTYRGGAYLWLGGKTKKYFTIPAVKGGSTIKMGVESHKTSEGRGVQLYIGGTAFGDAFTPTTYAENTWTVPEGETVDIIVDNTNGCHIYSIEVEQDLVAKLKFYVTKAKALTGVYTEESAQQLQTAIEAAEKVVADQEASEQDVKGALETLLAAKDALVEDLLFDLKEEVKAAIADAESSIALTAATYTEATVTALKDAIEKANEALSADEKTEESLTNAKEALAAAQKALVRKVFVKTVTYAVQEGESHTAGESVEVEGAAELTFGVSGGKDFVEAKANNSVDGFVAFTEGNTENGKSNEGTVYIIKPEYDGLIEVGIVLNGGPKFYVEEDGEALDDFNGITVATKLYGIAAFNVKGGSEYRVYGTGTKLGFYGFNYKYNTVEVSSHGWATYIPATAVEFEADDAYVVTKVNDANVSIESVTAVPAGTPVLLKGAGAKNITVIESATAPEENMLSVCDGTQQENKVAYVLAKDGDSAGFKQWTGEISELKDRAVLWLNDTQAARSFFALDGEATGIEIVAPAAAQDGAVYDLQGRRVAQPKNGLYIMNGKKVVVK